MDLHSLIDVQQKKLNRQQATLDATNREIDFVQSMPDGNGPTILQQLEAKRTRQHKACRATEEYLNLLRNAITRSETKKPTK